MFEGTDERTEQPTARRRQQLRRQGLVAYSPELSAAAVLLGGIAGLMLLGGSLAAHLAAGLAEQLGGVTWLVTDPNALLERLSVSGLNTLTAMLPLLGMLAVVALAVGVLQVGLVFSPGSLKPAAGRWSLANCLQRVVSLKNVVRSLSHLLKIAAAAAVTIWTLGRELPSLGATSDLDVASIAAVGWHAVVSLALRLAAVLGVLALLDYGIQRWRYERQLRMSPQELRQEQREVEGDPQLRRHRRALQRARTEPLSLVTGPTSSSAVAGGRGWGISHWR